MPPEPHPPACDSCELGSPPAIAHRHAARSTVTHHPPMPPIDTLKMHGLEELGGALHARGPSLTLYGGSHLALPGKPLSAPPPPPAQRSPDAAFLSAGRKPTLSCQRLHLAGESGHKHCPCASVGVTVDCRECAETAVSGVLSTVSRYCTSSEGLQLGLWTHRARLKDQMPVIQISAESPQC
jgi:hypothetical protein